MNMQDHGAGFAAVLDHQGRVRSVLFNDLVPQSDFMAGAHFADLLAPSSREKAERFLESMTQGGEALMWEMHGDLFGTPVPAVFSGMAREDCLLVACSTSAACLLDICQGLDADGREQAEELSGMLRERVVKPQLSAMGHESLFDEISRLNNDLINAHREMAKKNRELELLNTQKNVLLGMAAHDLRNPLGVMRNFASFLLDEHTDEFDEMCEEIITIVRDTSQHMLLMVEDLLDVSVIESGKLRLRFAPTDMVQLAHHSVHVHQHLAESKDIKIVFLTHGEIPLVLLDRSKISQVVDNLLSNAIKYSEPGSLIRVELERGNDNLILAVQDQGLGIREEEMKLLFKPFAKISARPTGSESSTGLGLAIVKRILEAHGGHIRVQSEHGKGSRFEAFLPLEQDAKSEMD
jgi:signal transduction histidine kinase